LLVHPAQLAQLNQQQPAFTVGSLINCIKVDSLLEVFRGILATADPAGQLQQLSDTLAECFDLRPSEKHRVGRDLGRLAPSPSLKYKAAAAT
ncbi:MAG: transposase, partial [Gammaproteobacteria bacterium]